MTQVHEATNKVFTLANCISFIRLCLVPTFLGLFFDGRDVAATIVFALAASTDFLDGQIARRTNTVSKVGQILDPVVDRALMISVVVALLISGRLPVWVIAYVLVRDAYLLGAGAYLGLRYNRRVPVIFAGKVATTLLFVGFAGLLLNMPLIPGLGLCDFAWLPGFNHEMCSWSVWLMYVGLIISAIVTFIYIRRGLRMSKAVRMQWAAEAQAKKQGRPKATIQAQTE